MKRLTFLQKHPDVSAEFFHEHWKGPHGRIAAGFAGLQRYHQHHVRSTAALDAPAHYFLDGIVELWFDDERGAAAGRDPEVTAALVDDEPVFLSGLTGFPVSSPGPGLSSAHTAWVLARWADGERALPDGAAHDLRALLPAVVDIEVNEPLPGARPFTREALAVDPSPPQLAIALRFGDGRPTLHDRETIVGWTTGLGGRLHGVEIVVADEIRIV